MFTKRWGAFKIIERTGRKPDRAWRGVYPICLFYMNYPETARRWAQTIEYRVFGAILAGLLCSIGTFAAQPTPAANTATGDGTVARVFANTINPTLGGMNLYTST